MKLSSNLKGGYYHQATKLNRFGLILLLLIVVYPLMANDNQPAKVFTEQQSTSELIAKCQQLEDQDPAAALTLSQAILSNVDPEKDALNYGHVLGCMGWSYVNQNKLAEARTKALEIEQLTSELEEVNADSIKLYRRAGSIFHRISDRISATENYNQAMTQAESLNLLTEQIPILVNLGVLNSELREHKQAIDNYYKALDLMKETEDFKYHAPVLFNLAVTLNGQKRYVEGLKVFQQVEDMVNEQWPTGHTSQVYHGLAAANLALKEFSLAEDYALQALQLLTEKGQVNAGLFNIKTTLASIYAQQGEDALATKYADEAKDYFINPDNRDDVLGSTNPLYGLASTYERLGLLNQAIQMHKTANEIEQQMQDTFNQEVMAQMQVRLNDSQDREALALLKNERINNQIILNEAKHKRKLWMLSSGAAVLLFLMFHYWQHLTKLKLKKMTLTDSLTQLGNRRATKAWLATHKIPDESKPRYLWLIDLDNFKAVNDEYNHDTGDMALQNISAALQGLDNKSRFVGRWGGEEFVIVTDDVAPKEKDEFSQLILNTVKQNQIQIDAASFNLTASVGCSQIVDQTSSAWVKAMYQADKAMYTAKSRGRNCAVFATGTI